MPVEVVKNWKSFLNFLKNLNDMSFDEYLFADQNNFASIELHGYCDASKTAYSAVIYARTIYKDKMTVKFVSAKSKIVSNKGLSIPTIELLPCLLLSKLVSTVVNAMSVKNNNNNNITFILMKGVLQSHMSYRLFTPHQ